MGKSAKKAERKVQKMYQVKLTLNQLIRLQVMVAKEVQELQEFTKDENEIGYNILSETLKDVLKLSEALSNAELT